MTKEFTCLELTIIVPVYNMIETLEKCISFILNQSFKNYEAIFVDDGSTDGSSDVLINYQELYPDKIIYLKTEQHSGAGGARNIGIKAAKGTYLGFVDADDWVDSNLFSVVIENMKQHNADIGIFGVKDEFDTRLSSKLRYDYLYFNCVDNDFAIKALSKTYNNDTYISPMVCQKIYKKSFITEHNLDFEENSYFEDDMFTFESFLYECKIIIIPKVYYHYYQRPNSIMHTFSKKHIDDLALFLAKLKANLCEYNLWHKYHTEYYAFSQKCIINTVNSLLTLEQDTLIQKKYISYLIKKLKCCFNFDEWIDFLDIESIRKLFM